MKERTKEEKPRRLKGDGALRKRTDGRWETYITIGYDETGKRLRKYAYGKTRAECVNKLGELKKIDFTKKTYINTDKITFSDLLDYWVEVRSRNIATSTQKNYKTIINAYIKPYIGTVKVEQISDRHIETRLKEINDDGKSIRTQEYVYTIINSALEMATTKDIILKNPCRKVIKPTPQRAVDPVPTQEEIKKIIECAYPKYRLFYEAAWETGARRGELLALDYRSLDHKEPGIYITKSAYPGDNGQALIKIPKNKTSNRKVLISRYLLDKLAGKPRRIAGYIFVDEEGKLFRPVAISKSFTAAVKKAGLSDKGFTLHSLRHAHAHELLKEKVPMEVVQQRLGHANIKMTVDRYGHVNSSFQVGIPDIIERIRKSL